jgi:hypothetical protein
VEDPEFFTLIVRVPELGAIVAETGLIAVGLGKFGDLGTLIEGAQDLLIDQFLHLFVADAEVVA